MGRSRGLKRLGRGLRRGFRTVKKFIGKTAAQTKTLLGRMDKLSGGAATQAIASHPYGQAGLIALNTADYYANDHYKNQ